VDQTIRVARNRAGTEQHFLHVVTINESEQISPLAVYFVSRPAPEYVSPC